MEEEFDGYECISQEQFLVRRLLAFMRSSQNLCTDTLCIDDATPPGQRNNNNDENGSYVMMTMLMCLMAVIMCFIRPESFMKLTNTKRSLQQGSGDDRNQQPPPPPPPPAIN